MIANNVANIALDRNVHKEISQEDLVWMDKEISVMGTTQSVPQVSIYV